MRQARAEVRTIVFSIVAVLLLTSTVVLVSVGVNRRMHLVDAAQDSTTDVSTGAPSETSRTQEQGSSSPATKAPTKPGKEEKTQTRTGKTETTTAPKTVNTTVPSTKAPGSNGKTVYLTFDDGPSAVTDTVLDVLKRYNVKATFFVIYRGGSGDRLRRIVDDGHTLALHSYTHKYSQIYASTDAFFEDLNKISAYVEQETGIKSKITRFPGGSSNEVSKSYSKGIMTRLVPMVTERGYAYFDWNCSSGDGGGSNIPVERLVKNTINTVPKTAKSVCVLMHDSPDKRTTAEALPQIIEYFRNEGYTFAALHTESPAIHHGIHN